MEARDAYRKMLDEKRRELLVSAEEQSRTGVAKWLFNEHGILCSVPADGSGIPEEHPAFFSRDMVQARAEGSQGSRGVISE